MTSPLTTVRGATTHALVGAAFAAVALLAPLALEAQAGPPLARLPQDSAPALRKPAAPSPPPSAVAPRSGAQLLAAPAPTDSGPRAMRPGSPPVETVRPAAVPPMTLDPARAPTATPLPPRPTTREAAGVQLVTPRAALEADVPPAGATARCKDGTFVTTVVDANTCGDNGGLAVRLPAAPVPPRRPNP